jgi:hypothetical protein
MRSNVSAPDEGRGLRAKKNLPTKPMRRIASTFAAAIFVVCSAVATPSQSAPTSSIGCIDAAKPNGPIVTCSVDFLIKDFSKPAIVGTHANFHAQMAQGNITMEWVDMSSPQPHVVATWDCSAPGLYTSVGTPIGGSFGFGPADLTPLGTCTQDITSDAQFATGPQRLVVHAASDVCAMAKRDQSSCEFHGAVQFEPAVTPI